MRRWRGGGRCRMAERREGGAALEGHEAVGAFRPFGGSACRSFAALGGQWGVPIVQRHPLRPSRRHMSTLCTVERSFRPDSACRGQKTMKLAPPSFLLRVLRGCDV